MLTPADSMRLGMPRVNPRHENILSRTAIVRGDATAALAKSVHVVQGTWSTQRIEHFFLEPESALAEPLPRGRMRLYSSGQGIFDDRRQVAAFLGVPAEDVIVEQISSGGAFGGKEDLSIQAQTALLAMMTGSPVRLTLSRQESVRIHPKRHPITMDYTVGCDAEGRLTAVKARLIGDTGAYDVPNAEVEALAVCTNNPPSGAMRVFGAPQTNFAIEGCLDLLAKKAGIDPWEIRWRNALDVGGTFTTGQVIEKSVGLKKTLLAVRDRYDEARRAGRAAGITCGVKNFGLGNGVKEFGRARLVIEQDGAISLYNGYSEVGQGLLTVLVQIAVEVTGLPSARFRPRADTQYALDCGQTTGSRATLLGGRAVADAAAKLRRDLDRGLTLEDFAAPSTKGKW